MKSNRFNVSPGFPQPFGISEFGDGYNFSIYSSHAKKVALCLFSHDTQTLVAEIPIDPAINKTGDVWHILIHNLRDNLFYSYRIDDSKDFLLDPYAKELGISNVWGKPSTFIFGAIIGKEAFQWEENTPPRIPRHKLIIYEMHVRGFTEHSSSEVAQKGSFLGLIEKIPYLVDLGINAVELLPVQQWNELEYRKHDPITGKVLCNYWGYSTLNFFSPMKRFASSDQIGSSIKEFKMMVRELHKHKIEVILDVVFNHTAEGGAEGPILSFKGLEEPVYYLLDEEGKFRDYTGCGNTVNCNHPVVIEMIIDCLRYWVTEMHVDGFRFDLASVFARDSKGDLATDSPLLEAITHDPVLADVKLIAEPWDAVGAYQVGGFCPATDRWSEWNGRYRDAVRRFIKGDSWSKGEFATRICGSQDMYGKGRSPSSSINFVIAHDGFTLMDLVSYNQKHNIRNGEDNRDGNNQNDSWNCGVEGPSMNQKIKTLRERQMRNFILALMISHGIPMVLMGDEYGHTKQGNNNTWCQDNDLNWFLWDQIHERKDFFRFYRAMIHFRMQKGALLQREAFLTPDDIEWHGVLPKTPLWDLDDKFVAMTLKDHETGNDLYIAFNASDKIQNIILPTLDQSKWHWIANTAKLPPGEFYDSPQPVANNHYKMLGHSALILEAKNL
jgi:isoamylase